LPRFPHLPPVIAPAQIPILICGICDKIASFSAFTAGHCGSSDSNLYLRRLRQNCLVFRIHRRSLGQFRFQSLFAAFVTKLPRFPHSPPVIAPAS
jgi:hypothetical protein